MKKISSKTLTEEKIQEFMLKGSNLNNQRDKKKVQGSNRYINLRLSIIDTGIGISKVNCSKLFINFNKL